MNNEGKLKTLVVNGFGLTEKSSLTSLREAAEFLGRSAKDRTQRRFVAANRPFKEQNRRRGLVAVPSPRPPSHEERELRELTHVPYQDWCDFCDA